MAAGPVDRPFDACATHRKHCSGRFGFLRRDYHDDGKPSGAASRRRPLRTHNQENAHHKAVIQNL